MGMFEMSPDQVAERRRRCLDLVAERVSVGISVKDDPVSQELIGTLSGTASPACDHG